MKDSKLLYWGEAADEVNKLIDAATLTAIKQTDAKKCNDCGSLENRILGIFGVAEILKDMITPEDDAE